MEEAAKVIGGVTGELLFFARSFLLGFWLRLGYEPLLLVRKLFRHSKLLTDIEDILFWTIGSFLMFGLLFRENNGTPRLFALFGILAGMTMYQLGPGRLTGILFARMRKKIIKRRKTGKKRLKKDRKDDMIKKENGQSCNERGDNSGRKDGSPQESKPQVDHAGTGSSSAFKCDDMDRRKQSGRADIRKSGQAKVPAGADRSGKGAQRGAGPVQRVH